MKKKGFTLIELIAAIAILAIIAVMVAPNVLGKFKESRVKAMIIQESKLVESGSILVEDYCRNPINDSYKQKCDTVVADMTNVEFDIVNLPEEKNNLNKVLNGNPNSTVSRKFVCIKDMKELGYYSEKLKYGNKNCSGFVVYLIDDNTGKEISNYSHIKCDNDSYVSGDNELVEALTGPDGDLISEGIDVLFEKCGEERNFGDIPSSLPDDVVYRNLTIKYIDFNEGNTLKDDKVLKIQDGKSHKVDVEQEIIVDGKKYSFVTSSIGIAIESPIVIDSNRVITLAYKEVVPQKVEYVVTHWHEKLDSNDPSDKNNYVEANKLYLSAYPGTLDLSNPDNQGALPSDYTGFNTPNSQTIVVNKDGTSTLNYYYSRKSYTVSINSDSEYGSVDKETVTVKYETPYTTDGNVLTFDDGTENGIKVVTATFEEVEGMAISFNSWSSASGVVVDDKTPITAKFNVGDNKYTVIFDCNGGENTMESVILPVGVLKPLPSNTCSLTGNDFSHWNDKKDGSGESYVNETRVDLAEKNGTTITLYAQWTPNSSGPYTLTFNPVTDTYAGTVNGCDAFNGSVTGSAGEVVSLEYGKKVVSNMPSQLNGSTITIPNITPAAVPAPSFALGLSWVFAGWTTADAITGASERGLKFVTPDPIFAPGSEVTLEHDTTLYAVWYWSYGVGGFGC